MGKVSITLETTEAQDESLTWLLACTNADPVHRETPLSDVPALVTELLQTAIEDAVPRCQAHRKACISTALDQASADQWAQIGKILQLDLPGGDAVAAVTA